MTKKKLFIPTHNEGCQIAAQYLKKKFNCGIVFVEPNPWANSEAPDALGFRPNNTSVLMEVKVQRDDFLKDKLKPHRANPAKGMGDYRFYVCPEGLIKPEELPPKWGLFYFAGRGSLKPVVAPLSLGSLQCPFVIQDYVATRMAEGDVAGYVQHMAEQYEQFCFPEKNVGAEVNVLYGGYRMQCMAAEQNVPLVIDAVFQRPNIKKR